MKYMILGGGGVFGVHLAKYLLHKTPVTRVICVGRNPMPAAQWTLGLEKMAPEMFRFEQVHVLYEPARLFKLMDEEKPDFIVNLAAQGFSVSWENSACFYETNTVALARMTEWLIGKPWLTRFIQIGTSELYGSVESPAAENAPLCPTSPYAVSKMAGDLHLQTLKNFPSIILRPSNCFAEAQQLYRIVPRAAWAAAMGVKIPLQGGGVAKKSYMHAEDLARAIVVGADKAVTGQIYNIGPDEPISIRDLVDSIARLSNLAPEQLYDMAPSRGGEDSMYWLNSDKMRALGWLPSVSIDDGIRRVQKWIADFLPVLGEPKPFVLRA